MIHASILLALAGLQADAPADPIAAAVPGLVAAIEQDELDPEHPRQLTPEEEANPEPRLESITTQGCTSRIVGVGGRSWTLDWRRIQVAAFANGFIYIRAPDLSLAIVGDASIPEQYARFVTLIDAMHVVHARCNPDAPDRWR